MVCLSTRAWAQAAVPAPETEASDPAAASADPSAPTAPSGAESMPAGAPATQPAPGPDPATAQAAPQAAPMVTAPTEPAPAAVAPVDNSANVTQVGALPNPRDAVFLGLGLGGGRMQDDVMGRGGIAFDFNGGYSFTPELSLTINFDGLIYSADTETESGAVEEPEAQRLLHYGISAGVQVHLLDVLRASLSGGYYGLTKDGPLKPLPGESDDDDADDESFGSPGGELAFGVEFFQSPGGFAAALEVRSQVSFPDGQLLWDSFALLGARWYGIGSRQPTPAPAQARTSSPSDT